MSIETIFAHEQPVLADGLVPGAPAEIHIHQVAIAAEAEVDDSTEQAGALVIELPTVAAARQRLETIFADTEEVASATDTSELTARVVADADEIGAQRASTDPIHAHATGSLDHTAARLERISGESKFKVREATLEDIPAMAEIDVRSFSKVYEGYGQTEDEQRESLIRMFGHRYELLGGKWMPVVTRKNDAGTEELVGFMHCCPTSKDPSEFTSWEDTTNNGKLDTLYDPDGKNLYVVTLSMDPRVKGQRGQNSLILQQIGSLVQNGLDTAFFESRMPGLRSWANRQCRTTGRDINGLNDAEKTALAQEYFGMKRERKGKQVPMDPLLRVYDGVGCKLLQVVPNAYQDEPSMNFGVLCTLDNPLPARVRQSAVVRNLVGGTMKLAAKSSWLTSKLFG